MKDKVIKQTLSIVVDLSLKEVLTDLAKKKGTTPSKYCAKILEDWVQLKGRGMSFKDTQPDTPTDTPKKYTYAPEEVKQLDELGDEIDDMASVLFNK